MGLPYGPGSFNFRLAVLLNFVQIVFEDVINLATYEMKRHCMLHGTITKFLIAQVNKSAFQTALQEPQIQ